MFSEEREGLQRKNEKINSEILLSSMLRYEAELMNNNSKTMDSEDKYKEVVGH